jgi:hypothetical protein
MAESRKPRRELVVDHNQGQEFGFITRPPKQSNGTAMSDGNARQSFVRSNFISRAP